MSTNQTFNQNINQGLNQPSTAFVGASWAVMLIGVLAYGVSLWNSNMILNEKGYYFAVLCLALYASVSLQKAIRDQLEGIPTSTQYNLISWVALFIAVSLQLIGLWNANLDIGEKGFYFMAFTMSMFGAITIQKNVRDIQQVEMSQFNHNMQLNNQTPSNNFQQKSEIQSTLKPVLSKD